MIIIIMITIIIIITMIIKNIHFDTIILSMKPTFFFENLIHIILVSCFTCTVFFFEIFFDDYDCSMFNVLFTNVYFNCRRKQWF